MLNELDNFYMQKGEPIRGCLIALKEIILSQDKGVSSAWKYGMPFFCYNGKMFCYIWVHKKHQKPYIGIVEGKLIKHPDLLIEKRSRMKIMLIDPNKDLPIKTINSILKQTIDLYKTGQMKIKVKK